jgi:hypothetical protein
MSHPHQKKLPTPIVPHEVSRGEQSDRRNLVMGGSLTSSPEGRLQTLQTHGMYPSPQDVQSVWTSSTRRRYPKSWHGQPLEQVGHVIEWEPREIACGKCHRSLGDYVAYRVLYPDKQFQGEQGVVEKTSRRYEPQQETARGQAASRGPKSQPRFQLKGEVGRRAAKTTACFRCPGCQSEYPRNLARLGAQLFDHSPTSPFLLA